MTTLPIPTSDALTQSKQLCDLIRTEIARHHGWIEFSRFMHLALYTPELGYYSGGAHKFGQAGDFVTAPEITPLFAQTLAQQVAQVLHETQGSILELGAGTGRLAADMLLALAQLNMLPTHYYLLEVSDHLRQIQRETLEKYLPLALIQKVQWLHALPENFEGLILGNELLDAIPVHLIHSAAQGLLERGVSFLENTFIWQDKPLSNAHLNGLIQHKDFVKNTADYLTEMCPAAMGLIASLVVALRKGVILMIDYGFAEAEYYHPQRHQGTLMCHYQHYAHDNPLINIGLQDITAHVNFTAMAQVGVDSGATLAGFTTQAQFLINSGITDLLAQASPADLPTYIPQVAAVQKLLSPAEMGDLFKVIALTKNFDFALIGFTQGDKSHTL